MNQSIGNKPLLILTGAAGRFGTEFVRQFSREFDIVALININRLPSVSDFSLFDAASGSHTSYPISQICCDLENFEETRRIVRDICALRGPPQYIVNAAADIRFLGSTLDYERIASAALRQFAVNALAPALVTSVVYQECWRQISPADQKASVLNVSSVSGLRFYKGTEQSAYAASKAALNMLTLYMAAEYMPFKIRVNAIAPGRFETEEETANVVRSAMQLLQESKTGQIVSG